MTQHLRNPEDSAHTPANGGITASLERMPSFIIKRLPAGFSFPLSKHSIKAYFCNQINLFRSIEISGISPDRNLPNTPFPRYYWVGILTANKDEDWSFDLHIEGMKNEDLEPFKDEVARLLLTDIKSFMTEKMALLETSPIEPRQLFLTYSIKGNRVVSNSHKVVKHR